MDSFQFQWQDNAIDFAVMHADGKALIQLWIKPSGDHPGYPDSVTFNFTDSGTQDRPLDDFRSMVVDPLGMIGPGMSEFDGVKINTVTSRSHQTHKDLWDWLNKSHFKAELTKQMGRANQLPRPVQAPPRSREAIAALLREIPEGDGSVFLESDSEPEEPDETENRGCSGSDERLEDGAKSASAASVISGPSV